tara:strand:+ start:168 stop:398 length:231 start_codon:yes stop_codon:yes gene_type:complete
MTFHPHVENLDLIPTIELEEKLQRLNKIYFMTDNEQIRLQMILLIDDYKLELSNRLKKKINQEKPNSNIDKLIKVS